MPGLNIRGGIGDRSLPEENAKTRLLRWSNERLQESVHLDKHDVPLVVLRGGAAGLVRLEALLDLSQLQDICSPLRIQICLHHVIKYRAVCLHYILE